MSNEKESTSSVNGTWTVKYLNEFNEPYYYTGDTNVCRHLDVDEWETSSTENALSIARDMLDVPEAKMTLEAVEKNFGDIDIAESKLVKIQDYYNGRYALFETVKDDIARFNADECSSLHTFHYDIPESYNSFDIRPDDNDNVHQISGYIELTFKKKAVEQ